MKNRDVLCQSVLTGRDVKSFNCYDMKPYSLPLTARDIKLKLELKFKLLLRPHTR